MKFRTALSDARSVLKMDTKIDIKQEDPFLDNIVPEIETEFYTNSITIKTHSDAVLLENDCDIAVKTEIKSETTFHELYLQKENKQKFLQGDPIMKAKIVYCSNHEGDDKIEIKEEPWWLEPEILPVYDHIKDEDFCSVKSARSNTEAVSTDSSDKSLLPSVEHHIGKNNEHEISSNLKYQVIHFIEKNIPSQHTDKFNDHKNMYSLNQNTLINKHKKSYKCEVCQKIFTALSGLNRHNLIHEGKKPHKCEICDKSFTRLSDLKKHHLIHEGKKQHKCEICDKRFARVSDLKRHTLIHAGKKQHKCDICDKQFTYVSNLRVHNLIHEGKKPHKCEFCEKRYTRSSSLKTHSFTHGGIKPHKCETCEMRFTYLSSLKSHNLIHEGKQPYKCEICERKFTQSANLLRHNLIHEGKKPYECEICEKRFNQLAHLNSHNLVHESKKCH